MKLCSMKVAFVACCIIFTLNSASVLADSSSHGWLLGTWELAYDPDNDPKDWLIFEEGQRITVRSPTGTLTRGTYRISDNMVTLFVIVGFRSLQIPMSVSPDRARLTNSSGAYYTKIVGP